MIISYRGFLGRKLQTFEEIQTVVEGG
jgi:hypothetical protein